MDSGAGTEGTLSWRCRYRPVFLQHGLRAEKSGPMQTVVPGLQPQTLKRKWEKESYSFTLPPFFAWDPTAWIRGPVLCDSSWQHEFKSICPGETPQSTAHGAFSGVIN